MTEEQQMVQQQFGDAAPAQADTPPDPTAAPASADAGVPASPPPDPTPPAPVPPTPAPPASGPTAPVATPVAPPTQPSPSDAASQLSAAIAASGQPPPDIDLAALASQLQAAGVDLRQLVAQEQTALERERSDNAKDMPTCPTCGRYEGLRVVAEHINGIATGKPILKCEFDGSEQPYEAPGTPGSGA